MDNNEFSFNEINVRLILKDLLKNFWLIVLAVLSAVLAVFTYRNIAYTPKFSSSATFAVSVKGTTSGTYASLTTAMGMADVFSSVFQSDVLKNQLILELGEEAADAQISSSIIPQTNLLVLTVTDASPIEAYQVLESLIENYSSVSGYVFGNATLEIIQNPSVPLEPSNTMPMLKYSALSSFLAAVAMAALIALISVLRPTVKTADTAEKRLSGTQLALIGHEVKNRTFKSKLQKLNKTILIDSQTVSFAFAEAYHTLASKVVYQMKKNNSKVLLVSSVLENEGKSTVSANLAIALAAKNYNVLLVDMDFRKSALYKIFDYDLAEENEFVNFLEGKATFNQVCFKSDKHNIYLMMNKKYIEDTDELLSGAKLGLLLNSVSKYMDYIILDSAPMLAAADCEAIADYADASLLVVKQDCAAVADINDAIDMLQQSNAKLLGYVLNDFAQSNPIQNDGYGYGYGYGYGTSNVQRRTTVSRKSEDLKEESSKAAESLHGKSGEDA